MRRRRLAVLYRMRPSDLIVWALLFVSAAASGACPADRFDAHAKVSYVFDGDTVELAGGTRVRLIGVDTPELSHEGRPEQPFARRARKALSNLLARHEYEVRLRYDAHRHDHYGRTLAHLYLADGTSISAYLLSHGLGTAFVVPPDVWNARCYRKAERAAQRSRSGIWRLARYKVVNAREIQRSRRGYARIRGRVIRVNHAGGATWIDLEANISARIPDQDRDYFSAKRLRQLPGKQVILRAWLYSVKHQLRSELRYPTDLTVLQ